MVDNVNPKKGRRPAKPRRDDEPAMTTTEFAAFALADLASTNKEPGSEPGPEPGSEAQNPESGGAVSEDRKLDPKLGAKIRVSLQDKVRDMLEEMKKDPNSEAAQMVYILLLNEVAMIEGTLSPEGLKALNEERHRYSLVKQLDNQRRVIGLKERDLRVATVKVNQRTEKLHRARDYATLTRHRLESGEELDMQAVCGRIADIVGLRPPPQILAGEQAESTETSGS